MINYFRGRSQEWLEEQLELCQEDIAAGKTLVEWGAGDSSSRRQIQTSPEVRFERLWYALFLIDPTTYPFDAASGAIRVRQTTARFF